MKEKSEAKDLLVKRLDKMVSRESLSMVAVIWSALEANLPPHWLGVVSSVLIAGLSLEKTAKAVWGAKLAIANAQAPVAKAATVVDSQDEVKESI